MNNEMPKGGAKELLSSTAGRRYLAELQKRHYHDIVQPSQNPHLFNQLYGHKIKRNAEIKATQENNAQSEWQELRSRKEYKKTKTIII